MTFKTETKNACLSICKNNDIFRVRIVLKSTMGDGVKNSRFRDGYLLKCKIRITSNYLLNNKWIKSVGSIILQKSQRVANI